MTKIVFAGFGGQGIMTLGQIVAIMAMQQERQVAWMPSYGAEMRGGTANCSVVISDLLIGNPYVLSDIDVLCALNMPSVDKFLSRVRPGGAVLINSSIVTENIVRDDVAVIAVEATNIAAKAGNVKVQNMAMLGGLMKVIDLFTIDNVERVLEDVFQDKNPGLIPLNLAAVKAGMQGIERI